MIDTSNFSPKSFWEKPEGKTGIIFIGLMAIGGGYLLYHALPIIIALLANTLHAMILLGAIGIIVYLLLDKRFRTLVSFIYKSIMRFITKIFVEIDPIGIIENYIDDLKDNLSKMDKQIANLKGQMRKLKKQINENKDEMQNSLKLAQKARDAGKDNIVILKSRKAGRLKDSTMTLQALYTKMEILYRVLGKMYENASFLLEDIESEVDVRKKEREAIRASHSALKSAMKVVSGDRDKRAMFDMAMDAVADDVGKKIGEMERFMEISENFMDSIDLQKGIYEEDGLKLLEQWENESSSILLDKNDKKYLLDMANNDNEVLDLDKSLEVSKKNSGSQYSKLFEF
jgi:phage shock protein A